MGLNQTWAVAYEYERETYERDPRDIAKLAVTGAQPIGLALDLLA